MSGQQDLALERLLKSVTNLEDEMVDLKRNRVNSLKSIEQSFMIQEQASMVQCKNDELRMMAEEALKNKNLAERALNRLEAVNELGKKLTLSLDLTGIIDTVYSNLLKNVPMEVFIIMIKDEKENMLKSLVFYDHGKPKEGLALDANSENSMFVETFQSNRYILIDDVYLDTRFHKKGENIKDILSRSVLSFPLSIENNVIGVCSLQHTKPNMYNSEHVNFLEELMPYLAIAMNNAFKSSELEKEIKQHKLTQSKLKLANRRLAAISNIDGLTQISNRRDFEKRVQEYLIKADRKKQSVSMFMFDIDHFKLFNDTYGHLDGDEVLKSVAAIVRDNIDKEKGISARFGGEEFIATCINLSEERALEVAENIREEVYRLHIKNEKAPLGIVTISVGLAYADGSFQSKKSILMRWADISLYRAKRTGKNKVVLKRLNVEENAPESLNDAD
ncbi:MAG: sensor domain-containing diguanylate cyclase, partial [Bacillota bacterium]|nr:sensor domain-containing diguanylate cyclase [Bacillota bacterium]